MDFYNKISKYLIFATLVSAIAFFAAYTAAEYLWTGIDRKVKDLSENAINDSKLPEFQGSITNQATASNKSIHKSNGSSVATNSSGDANSTHISKINSSPAVQTAAKERNDKQKAVTDLLQAARNYINKNGKAAAMTEFSKNEGAFSKEETYVFAVGYDGTVLASDDSVSIGSNMFKAKNALEKSVAKLQLETAKAGGGWISYRWKNPVSKQIDCKRSYILPLSGFFIGTGYYFQPSEGGKCE